MEDEMTEGREMLAVNERAEGSGKEAEHAKKHERQERSPAVARR